MARITYTCDGCGSRFPSGRKRPEPRYCALCVTALGKAGLGVGQARAMDREEVRTLIAEKRAGAKRLRPQPERNDVTENLNRTPIDEFILKVHEWRNKYLENNMSIFRIEAFIQRNWGSQYLSDPLYKDRYEWVENRIIELKGKEDVERLEDDLEIVYHWGGGLGPRLFAQIKKNNLMDEIQKQIKVAFDALEGGQPAEALEELKRLKYCSDAFGSKVLAMRSPWNAPIWDNIAQTTLSEFKISGKKVRSYEQFIAFCEHVADKLQEWEVDPPRGERWYLRDIEMALFQFGWDNGKFNGRITGQLP